MSALQAIPTQHGIDILNSELKNTVTKYRLIGALTHDAPNETLYSFYENTIETSYYDDNGVLTFILNLPIEQHFDEYLHQIDVLDSANQAVIECSTPKVALPKSIGGMITLKAAVSGEAGQVIFKHSEFVTETELFELYLPNKEDVNNAATNNDIDNESDSQKHLKLPQFWRALGLDYSINGAVNGYVRFPKWLGGITFQWGIITTEHTQKTYSYPTSYRNRAFVVLITESGSVTGAATIQQAAINTASTFYAAHDTSSINEHSAAFFSVGI